MQERAEQTTEFEELDFDTHTQNPGLAELQEIFKGLPLERCSYEHNPVTGEWGWHAPRGFAFKLAGQFIIDSDQSDITYRNRPWESADLFKADNSDLYKRLLEEANGDEEEAMTNLKWEKDYLDVEEFPEDFVGKWLIFSLERGFSEEIETDCEGKHPVVKVKGDMQAWYDQDHVIILNNITPNTDKETSVFFSDSVRGVVVWQQTFSKVVIGACKLELVEIEEEEHKLFVPDTTDRSKLAVVKGSSEGEYSSDGEVRMYPAVVEGREGTDGAAKKSGMGGAIIKFVNGQALLIPYFGSRVVLRQIADEVKRKRNKK